MNLSVILLPVYKERRDRSGYIFRSSQVDDIDPKLPKSIETVGGYQMPKCAITSELRVKVIIGKFFCPTYSPNYSMGCHERCIIVLKNHKY